MYLSKPPHLDTNLKTAQLNWTNEMDNGIIKLGDKNEKHIITEE